MNSYRIDTFELEDGRYKAVAYRCGTYIGEDVGESEAWAVAHLGVTLVDFIEADQ